MEQTIHYFVLDLPHSDACFVKVYPAETTEAFCERSRLGVLVPGRRAAEHLVRQHETGGGQDPGRRPGASVLVCSRSWCRTTCSRTGSAVPARVTTRARSRGWWDMLGRNFLVPVPSFPSFDALNAYLEERCLERMGRQLRGHRETIGQRMERDLEALLAFPAVPYDASDKHVSRVSSLSLVRYRTNDYSVPVAYGHREVVVRGYVGDVVISCGAEVIARHPRSYERRRLRLRPCPLPAAAGAQDGSAGPGCSFGRVGVAGGVRHAAQTAGVEDGQARQAGVRTGAAVGGELPQGGGVRGRA